MKRTDGMTMTASFPKHPSVNLDEHYSALEARWPTTETGAYESLVVSNGNGGAPVHRWFQMKEAYSQHLLPRLLTEVGVTPADELAVVDPYCGSGTTGVALAERLIAEDGGAARFLGIEANPFLHLAASTKLRALQEPPADFHRLAGRIAAHALKRPTNKAPAPGLSTFHRAEYVPPDHLDELLRLRAAADDIIDSTVDPIAADLVRLCIGATVEPAIFLRRDGRALRYEPGKRILRPIDEFLRRAAVVDEDLPRNGVPLHGHVRLGDARDPTLFANAGEWHLAVFSPPYPNNIDYTEIYKLEAWLLGFVQNDEEFAAQRRRTLRSHPSLKFNEDYSYTKLPTASVIESLISPIIDAIPAGDRYTLARGRLVRGYVDDMLATMRHLRSLLAPGAPLVYIVGNSVHGSGDERFVIAADLLLAALAELAGFQIDRIEIARRPARRGSTSRFIRESVVFARASRRAASAPRECSIG